VYYTAVLGDGSLVPFENRYDKNHPPRLHVVCSIAAATRRLLWKTAPGRPIAILS